MELGAVFLKLWLYWVCRSHILFYELIDSIRGTNLFDKAQLKRSNLIVLGFAAWILSNISKFQKIED